MISRQLVVTLEFVPKLTSSSSESGVIVEVGSTLSLEDMLRTEESFASMARGREDGRQGHSVGQFLCYTAGNRVFQTSIKSEIGERQQGEKRGDERTMVW